MYDHTLELDPKCEIGYSNKGVKLNLYLEVLHNKLGKYNDAITTCKRILEMNQNDFAAYYNLG